MRIGSLFTGYGGLELGVRSVLEGELAFTCDNDPSMRRLIDWRFPGVPNLGDVTAVDWSRVEPVDVLTGGFPCQDVSHAGARLGMVRGSRSGLWSEMAVAVSALRPQLVLIENVRGLLYAEADRGVESESGGVGERGRGPALRALGAVLGDLAEIGYDARWCGVRASDAGAPHARFRVFIAAYPNRSGFVGVGGLESIQRYVDGRGGADPAGHGGEPAAPAGDPQDERGEGSGESGSGSGAAESGVAGGPDEDPELGAGDQRRRATSGAAEGGRARPDPGGSDGVRDRWGRYAGAVERWERVLGRVAPPATALTGRGGSARLSPRFVEWMMGLPDGWVTDPELELTRGLQLRALGNGVVPQQAALALRYLLREDFARAA